MDKESNSSSLNLEATELTLGPPKSQSSETSDENKKNNPVFTSHLILDQDGVCSSVSGNKRIFSETFDEKSCTSKSETCQSTSQGNTSVTSPINVDPPRLALQQQSTPKAEVVVGWPPVKVRKHTPNHNDKVDGKRALFVKVSMNGAPYLRKVDLRGYTSYQQLSLALQKMFSRFTLGTCAVQEDSGTEIQGESGLRDKKQGSKHVLTYEDKDGDWMLVGDIPWGMFIESCKKLKIMKSSDVIGFAHWCNGKVHE